MARETPYPQIDIDEVREYLQARADRSSVRAVAAEIGMRHTTLGKFLEGSEPYPRNRILMIEWYLREYQKTSARGRVAVPEGVSEQMQAHLEASDPEAHLEALLAEFKGDAHTETRRRIIGALAQGYQRMGRQAPRWLHRVRANNASPY